MMRLALVLLLMTTAAFAEDDFYKVDGPSVAIDETVQVPGELDTLFDALRRAPNFVRAKQIEDRIWSIWMRAPDARAASRMNRNIKYRGYGEYWEPMDQIGHVIRRFPDYPEAWNQRSYLHFLQGDFERSLADCRKALELEPRHFGCLGGMARTLVKLGRRDEAREVLKRGLAVHPFLTERRLFPDLAVPRLDL